MISARVSGRRIVQIPIDEDGNVGSNFLDLTAWKHRMMGEDFYFGAPDFAFTASIVASMPSRLMKPS